MIVENEKKRVCFHAAFTLVELLVVVTIIGLLIGMLMPALARARQTAQSACCAAQLKQFAWAMDAYADDNNDWYPAADPFRGQSEACRWFKNEQFMKYLHVTIQYDQAGLPIGPAEEADGIMACPSDKNSVVRDTCSEQWYTLSYTMNAGFGLSKSEGDYRRRNEYEYPAQSFVFADGRVQYDYIPGLVFPCFPEHFDFRHNNAGANFAFLDGHVASHQAGELPLEVDDKYGLFWNAKVKKRLGK